MQISIQARSFSLTNALSRHIQQRLRFALTSCSAHIQRVVVRLSDINGPRGGQDKRCHIQVALKGLPDVVIEDTESNLYTAIARAAGRAGRTVARRLRRRRAVERTRPLPTRAAHAVSESDLSFIES